MNSHQDSSTIGFLLFYHFSIIIFPFSKWKNPGGYCLQNTSPPVSHQYCCVLPPLSRANTNTRQPLQLCGHTLHLGQSLTLEVMLFSHGGCLFNLLGLSYPVRLPRSLVPSISDRPSDSLCPANALYNYSYSSLCHLLSSLCPD